MINLEKEDMQGLIVRSYKDLKAACFILIHVTNRDEAKSYLTNLIDEITPGDKQSDEIQQALQIAITSKGLKALGLTCEMILRFSREFVEGMDEKFRSKILGDYGNNSPDQWQWGSHNTKDTQDVHLVLLLYAKTPSQLAEIINDQKNKFKGITILEELESFDTPESREHFGFQDGISQPTMEGLNSTTSTKYKVKDPIKAGEFILGYPNEYNHYGKSPYVDCNDDPNKILPSSDENNTYKDLGKNGTYLIFRQLKQEVFNFWKYLKENSREPINSDSQNPQIEAAIKLGAKMVGRWPGGASLVNNPEYDDRCKRADNKIGYSKNDKLGEKCPFGAHIRRTNPRDQLFSGRDYSTSNEMTRKHQILRRGRVFGKPLVPTMHPEDILMRENDDGEKRGLHFICLVSDISRQFEFIQNVWVNNTAFGDLYNEVDPIIGTRQNSAGSYQYDFTCPGKYIRRKYKDIPQFVQVLGGAYFFMPGIRALKFIVSF